MKVIGLKAAIRYKVNRQYVYRWRKRYDGMLQSLADKSHRPHRHPNQHTPEELKLIADMRKRNANAGLVVFWVKLRKRGYSRSITGLYRVLRRQGQMAVKPPNPKYTPTVMPPLHTGTCAEFMKGSMLMKTKHCANGKKVAFGNFGSYHFFDNFLHKSRVTAIAVAVILVK